MKLDRITWSNIYYMIKYCVEELEYFDDKDISYDNIKCTDDLLAEMLIKSLEKIVENGYIKRYIPTEIETKRPYGMINIKKSFQTGVYSKAALICNVDRFDINNQINQVIKATVKAMIDILENSNSNIDENKMGVLKQYEDTLSQVESTSLNRDMLNNIKIENLENWAKPVIAVSKLILDEYMALDEEDDESLLALNEHSRLCRIWEKFVRRFLRDEYEQRNPEIYSVVRPTYIKFGTYIQPDMCIINNITKKALVIDTKWYESEKATSSNDGQVTLYCCEVARDKKHLKVIGCAMYAYSKGNTLTVEDITSREPVEILQARTKLNVNQDSFGIEKDIKELVDKYIN